MTASGETLEQTGRGIDNAARWRSAMLSAAVVLVAELLFYAPTLEHLWRNWDQSSDYGHAFLVIPIVGWLIWRDRARLARIAPRTQPLALAVVVVGALAWLAARVMAVGVGRELALYALLIGTLWSLLGWAVLRRLAFPIAYLSLVLTFWSLLLPALQHYTALMAARALDRLGVPVLLEGHYLSIPNGRFVVEEVCAGLRFLLATLAIASLHTYLSLHRWWRRALAVGVAAVLAIVFNWLRVVIIIGTAFLYGMQFPMVRHHIALGWVVFMIALIPFAVLTAYLQGGDAAAPPARAPAAPSPTPALGRRVGVALACALIALAAPLSWGRLEAAGREAQRVHFGALPAVAGYTGPFAPEIHLGSRYAGADVDRSAVYRDATGEVQVTLVYYAREGPRHKLVSDVNRVVDPHRWSQSGGNVVRTDFASPALPERVDESLLESADAGRQRLLWSWYYVAGHYSTNRYTATALRLLGLSGLSGEERGSALFMISTPTSDTGRGAARARLRHFAARWLPEATGALQRTGVHISTG